jgi:hypothetical protein
LKKALTVALLVCAALVSRAEAAWDPAAWVDTKTLEFLTDCPEEGEYWSPVWLVVLEDHVYISLGSKAAGRLACSRLAPMTAIKIEGQLYENVRLVPETALAGRIEDARWDKYWTNVFVGFSEHAHYRLDVEPGGAAD